MRNRTLPLMLLALALLVASTVYSPSARAQSSCDLGFALTHGGVAEADINGDGLTCEFNTVDSITGVWTTIALDNVPPDISAPDQCPDHFVSTPWPCGVTPDRNMDCKVCMKATQGHVFFVDDNAKSGSCVSNPTKCKAPDKCTVAACDATTGLCVFTPVVCTASDQCHVPGTCDLATGQCSNPPAPDGTACNDGNLCTFDNCQAGMCTPFIGKTCPAGCDPATGMCI